MANPKFANNVAYVMYAEPKHAQLAFNHAMSLKPLEGITTHWFKAKRPSSAEQAKVSVIQTESNSRPHTARVQKSPQA